LSNISTSLTEIYTGWPAALAWLKDRHDGKPVDKGCKTTTVMVDSFSTMSISEQILMYTTLIKDVLALFGTNL
jgi:hypothetical protein